MAKNRMPSLRQIAAAANLSVGTVSRALRNDEAISKSTRAKVLSVANDLNYMPNRTVAGITKGRSHLVGVMVNPRLEFSARILAGAHDVLMRNRYAPVFLYPENTEHDAGAKCLHSFMEYRVDGVIAMSPDPGLTDDYFEEIWSREIPLVTVDMEMIGTNADFVGTDDVKGTTLAAEHLLSLGHRRFGMLSGPFKSLTVLQRKNAFERAINKVSQTSCVVVEAPWFFDAEESAIELLSSNPRPTAIFCHSDSLAECLYSAAERMGLNIPEDVSVVGYSDSSIAKYLRPSLTTLRQDSQEIGRQAAKILLSRVEEETDIESPIRVRLEPELIVRESTRKIG